jgi:hypothetical protein
MEWYWLNPVHEQLVFDHREKLYALYGEEAWSVVGGLIWRHVDIALYFNDSAMFEQCIVMAQNYLPEPHRSQRIYQWRSDYYAMNSRWAEYTLLTDEYYLKDNYDWPWLTAAAWSVYENTSDTTVLSIAAKWIAIDLKRDTCWHVYDAHAVLLYKTGRLEEAEAQAITAIEKATEAGEHATGSLLLLDLIAERRRK